jgi:flagellar basal-body rod protein FlgC
MNNLSVFDISGRAMAAQMVRLNTTASNLANAGSVAGSASDAFRALKPVFRSIDAGGGTATVAVDRILRTDAAPVRRHDPGHPLADDEGYVWDAAVDSNVELVEMLEAARQYQNNLTVLETAKTLMLDTIRIGK